MTSKRIIILGIQRMMREIIENTVQDQPDLDVVSLPNGLVSSGTGQPLVEAIMSANVDAVITSLNDPEFALALLERQPHLTLLAVLNSGRETLLYRLGLRCEELGELSSSSLLAALRTSGYAQVGARLHGPRQKERRRGHMQWTLIASRALRGSGAENRRVRCQDL